MVDQDKELEKEREKTVSGAAEAEPKRKGEQEIREAARIESERRKKEYGQEEHSIE